MRAKGTVRPSEKPRVKSERNRMRRGLLDFVMMKDVVFRRSCDDGWERCASEGVSMEASESKSREESDSED